MTENEWGQYFFSYTYTEAVGRLSTIALGLELAGKEPHLLCHTHLEYSFHSTPGPKSGERWHQRKKPVVVAAEMSQVVSVLRVGKFS